MLGTFHNFLFSSSGRRQDGNELFFLSFFSELFFLVLIHEFPQFIQPFERRDLLSGWRARVSYLSKCFWEWKIWKITLQTFLRAFIVLLSLSFHTQILILLTSKLTRCHASAHDTTLNAFSLLFLFWIEYKNFFFIHTLRSSSIFSLGSLLCYIHSDGAGERIFHFFYPTHERDSLWHKQLGSLARSNDNPSRSHDSSSIFLENCLWIHFSRTTERELVCLSSRKRKKTLNTTSRKDSVVDNVLAMTDFSLMRNDNRTMKNEKMFSEKTFLIRSLALATLAINTQGKCRGKHTTCSLQLKQMISFRSLDLRRWSFSLSLILSDSTLLFISRWKINESEAEHQVTGVVVCGFFRKQQSLKTMQPERYSRRLGTTKWHKQAPCTGWKMMIKGLLIDVSINNSLCRVCFNSMTWCRSVRLFG